MGAIFSVFPDLMESSTVARILHSTGEQIVLATDRQRALTEFQELGKEVTALIVGVSERINESVLQTIPNCRVVGSVGVGTDHLDLTALRTRNIALAIPKAGTNAISVAEHTLMTMLALSKQLLPSHSAVLSGQDRAGLVMPSRDLSGKTIGILGAGHTALALTRLLKAFGVKVLVWTAHPKRHPEMLAIGAVFTTLPELLKNSDVVSTHVPLTDQTRGLLNYQRLVTLKTDAIVINVARLEIFSIPDLALVARARPDLWFGIDDFGLQSSGIVAALDDHCIATPHTARLTVDSQTKMRVTVSTQLVDALAHPLESRPTEKSEVVPR